MGILKKYKSLPVQTKASIWYTICNFFQKGISFIVVPIYVRLLTTGEYGEWQVFQSWRDILIILASLNLYAGVYTKTLVDNKNDRDRYTSSMQGLGTLISLLLLIIYLLTHDWCNKIIKLDTPYMLLLFLYFIVYPGFSFWTTGQRVEYKYRSMVAVTVVISIFTPILSILFLQKTDLRANALILGYLLVQCAAGLVFYVYQFWKGKCFFHKGYWRHAARFNIPLIPHYLSLIVLNQSDRIMIEYICGKNEAGIYGFAYQIASAINVLISAINGSRVPWTYEKLKAKVYDGLKRITNALVILMAGIVLFVSLLSPEVIKILGTSDYQVAVYVIPVVTLGVFYTFVYDLFASVEFYYGATKYVMYASVIGAVLNIILNAVFIQMFGFIAAAYTTLVCYLVFMLMHCFFSRKVLKEQNINTPVYDNKMIFALTAAASAIALSLMATYPYPILRAVLIAVFIILCIVFRNSIKRLLAKLKNDGES